MNSDTMEGTWKQMKGKVKEKWGQLTDNEITETKGNMEQLEGLIQKKYGTAREEAKKQLSELQRSCGSC